MTEMTPDEIRRLNALEGEHLAKTQTMDWITESNIRRLETTMAAAAKVAWAAHPNNPKNKECPDCGLPFYEDEDRIITDECVCGWRKR